MAKINNMSNIETFNVAIGCSKNIETFSVNEHYSPNFSKDLNGKYKINVQQNLIDDLINIYNKKIAIKMDVERAEFEAIKGSKNLLKNNECLIIIETEPNSNAINLLCSIGYKIIENKLDTADIILSNYK